MGTEMIAKAADSFERKQRESLERLEQPNLFTCAPQFSCGVIATPQAGHVFRRDERYRLTLSGKDVIVVQGISTVGRVDAPAPSLLHALRGSSPAVCGRVDGVSMLSGQAELILE